MLNYDLLTPYGERLDKNSVLPEYPRPQLRRDGWLNLNGEWDYAINRTGETGGAPAGRITVPFPLESCLSGVRRALEKDEWLIYTRTFDVPDDFLRDITLLHIGAVDQLCDVFLNGAPVGSHAGGYLPVTLDVSAAVRPGANELVVRVRDELSELYPTGKQRAKRGGIWYTPVSGIWQTVWLESVRRGYIRELRITPDIDRKCVDIEIDSEADSFGVTVRAAGAVLLATREDARRFSLPITDAQLRLWSPEDPFLYELTVTAPDDTVSSYFAMRKFAAQGRRFFLNNKPYFINGLLDQGYFSDGIYTPASYDAYRDDILRMKALGFNTLRKHIKLEPMMFYHLCDTLGMLVLQDMVNIGRYSFLKDSGLPFAGFRRHIPYVNVNKRQRENFTAHSLAVARQLYSAPCVVYYTIFNEGWGQFPGDALYDALKAADPGRVYDTTSGWFHVGRTDVTSEHVYFRPIELRGSDRPLIVSEFGGYSFDCPGHIFNTEHHYGYRHYTDRQKLEDDFAALYENEILPAIRQAGLAGAIYTQVSDVEDETNGILTYDRRECKLDAGRILPLMRRVCAAGAGEEAPEA
ncbi:MAG: glycoside hydrolase family 2 TIM barrel-domain containing protein [Oscillospiraceae bacterium]|nr:glycoside hydrolase family 2 TIM barrel-domain containing protein [Oscillospiraceae bacterium]